MLQATRPVPPGVPTRAEVLGRLGSENFTVATRLLGGREHRALVGLYAFARLVDTLGDAALGDRMDLLDWADAEIDRAIEGSAAHPVFVELGELARRHRLGPGDLHDLVAANRVDQTVARYETFEDLRAYCALSANPVGRLVLAVFGRHGPTEVADSDSVCTGLQVIEHCQDVVEDAAAGRVYLPATDLAAHGTSVEEVRARQAPAAALAAVVRLETGRARELLARGPGLARRLGGRARLAVAGFVGGGLAAADALARAGYDVSGGSPRAGRRHRLTRTLEVLGGGR